MDFEAKAKELLGHVNHHTIEEEMWRIVEALKQCAEEAIEVKMRDTDENHCGLCGTRVKIVGKTTLHYEPVITPKEAARKSAEYFMYEIHKRPMESEGKICEEAIKHAIGEGGEE